MGAGDWGSGLPPMATRRAQLRAWLRGKNGSPAAPADPRKRRRLDALERHRLAGVMVCVMAAERFASLLPEEKEERLRRAAKAARRYVEEELIRRGVPAELGARR